MKSRRFPKGFGMKACAVFSTSRFLLLRCEMSIKEGFNTQALVQEYVKHLYNDYPESLIVAYGDLEMTVADWCQRFGGTPKGETNFEFLDAQFKKLNKFNDCEAGGRIGDDG
jgi:hypothetical protein